MGSKLVRMISIPGCLLVGSVGWIQTCIGAIRGRSLFSYPIFQSPNQRIKTQLASHSRSLLLSILSRSTSHSEQATHQAHEVRVASAISGYTKISNLIRHREISSFRSMAPARCRPNRGSEGVILTKDLEKSPNHSLVCPV